MIIIYVVLNEDGTAIVTYFGIWDPGDWPYGKVVTVKSSDQLYYDYYALMTTYGMQYGMVDPD